MIRGKNGVVFSASDLNHYLSCRHSIYLDREYLDDPKKCSPKMHEDPEVELLKEKGLEHEKNYLNSMKERGLIVYEVLPSDPDKHRNTLDAMKAGVDIIYQAALLDGGWQGYADFLRKVNIPSKFGNFGYEAVDTKLARQPKPEYIIQLCVYSDLVSSVQGNPPRMMHIVIGDGQEKAFRYSDFRYYYLTVKGDFERHMAKDLKISYPSPNGACPQCRWFELCDSQLRSDDHLSLVANITRSQIQCLNDAGIKTVAALAKSRKGQRIEGISKEAFERLMSQAELQTYKRTTGKNKHVILEQSEGRGFYRLPKPDPGDLFFDMEGDPYYPPDGLEYLFGFSHYESGKLVFTPFWAHDFEEERKTFQKVVDFVTARIKAYPNAHVYHYSSYEDSAMKRLAAKYGTREKEVDDILRGRKMVDLYKVVREGIRVSESGYSIKNLETFYMGKREGDVATAGDSIVFYERWRRTGNKDLLEKIRAYNEDDCRSTCFLRDWLLKIRPKNTPWFNEQKVIDDGKDQDLTEAERRVQAVRERLVKGRDKGELTVYQLIGDLLEYHRREAKPQWWAMFDRQTREVEDLIDDYECIGKLEKYQPPFPVKRSMVYSFRFPPQEFKFKVGDKGTVAATLENAGEIVALDPDACTIGIKRGQKGGLLPNAFSLIPSSPIDTGNLKESLFRYAESAIANSGRHKAITSLLKRELPSITGHTPGEPILSEGANDIDEISSAVARLSDSYLFIQGPPGAGKTFTSAKVIVDLIKKGKKVGVSSNSHKAIVNLLEGVEAEAKKQKVAFFGQRKGSDDDDSGTKWQFIRSVEKYEEISREASLVAGTAWLFSREQFEGWFDHLFVDEAGQVSLANIVASGMAARNIVLIGDQMQLGQPTQGVHPGDSGLSVLDFLLQDEATISPAKGIFLGTTWRMHGKVCKFISDAVYDGKLLPQKKNNVQALELSRNAHSDLLPNGIKFLPVKHSGCSQKSAVEGQLLLDLYSSLLKQGYIDREGRKAKVSQNNILVVAPYNVQVNYLKTILPDGARIGTVDKFQGQEAEVVLISMTTSSSEDLPRNIEFLYSKNRLNVAISRAKTLAVIIASADLLNIACKTIEQMRLVNTLCWARNYCETVAGQ